MLCSMCHKNEAVICYTEIVNGIKKEQYLCPECAAKYTAFDSDSSGMTPGSLLAGLLTSVLGQAGIAVEDDSKKTNLVCKNCGMTYNEFLKYSRFGCSECVHTFGFLLDDYLKKIQGSCEHIGKKYAGAETVFVPELKLASEAGDDGGSQSTAAGASGKNSSALSGRTEGGSRKDTAGAAGVNQATVIDAQDSDALAALKRELAAAIKAEEYEQAAKIRDMIRDLKVQEELSHRYADMSQEKDPKEASIDEKMV